MSCHPEVVMPLKKEIRYLGSPYGVDKRNWIMDLLTSDEFVHKQNRQYFRNRCGYYKAHWTQAWCLKKHIWWDFKYMFMPRSDKWYTSLFDRDAVSGDVSPDYYLIPEEGVYKISQLLPKAKIIFMLRDPIDRLWSFSRMLAFQHQKLHHAGVSTEQLCNMCELQLQNAASYVTLVSRWKRYFSDENVFVGFYDELAIDPLKFFRRICDYMEIESENLSEELIEKISRIRNQGVSLEMPREFAVYHAALCKQNIQEMCEYFLTQKYPKQWLDRCDQLLLN